MPRSRALSSRPRRWRRCSSSLSRVRNTRETPHPWPRRRARSWSRPADARLRTTRALERAKNCFSKTAGERDARGGFFARRVSLALRCYIDYSSIRLRNKVRARVWVFFTLSARRATAAAATALRDALAARSRCGGRARARRR